MPPKNFSKKSKKNTQTPTKGHKRTGKANSHAGLTLQVAARGQRGSLSDLPRMPLDIIFEILVHMHPLDLLRLARTSKAFRSLLLNRSSAPFWKRARCNVDGLPDCPPTFSEPAYASLAFESSCNACRKPNIKFAHWKLGVRLCKHCLTNLTQSVSSAYDPPGRSPKLSLQNIYRSIINSQKGHSGYFVVLTSEVEEFRTAWENAEPSEHTKLLEERNALVKQSTVFAKKFSKWDRLRKKQRVAELDELRQIRQEAILQELEALGWEEEVQYFLDSDHDFERFLDVPGVWDTKALPDSAWQNLEDSVVGFMEGLKCRRLQEGRAKLLKERFSLLPDIVSAFGVLFANVFPTRLEFALLPEVRKILDAPATTQITTVSLNALKPQLPDLVRRWKAEVTTSLTERINCGNSLNLPPGADLASLAQGTYYYCTTLGSSVRRLKTYPNVLTHIYVCNAKSAANADDYSVYAGECFPYIRPPCAPWVFQVMQHIIEASGCDATQVSPEEMDNLDIRLLCVLEGCKDEDHYGGVQAVYTWRSAITHALHSRVSRNICKFKSMSKELFQDAGMWEKILSLEKQASDQAVRAVEESHYWQCKYCTTGLGPFGQAPKSVVVSHVRTKHAIENPGPDDIFLQPECPIAAFNEEPIYILPEGLTSAHSDILKLPFKIKQAVSRGQVIGLDSA